MDGKVFQRIYEELEPVLPPQWRKVVLRACYTEGSYSIKYYAAGPDEKLVDCYQIPGINKMQLIKIFSGINKVLVEERKSLTGKDIWSVLTMVFDDSGAFKTDFYYGDISETFLAFQEAWEKQYLN